MSFLTTKSSLDHRQLLLTNLKLLGIDFEKYKNKYGIILSINTFDYPNSNAFNHLLYEIIVRHGLKGKEFFKSCWPIDPNDKTSERDFKNLTFQVLKECHEKNPKFYPSVSKTIFLRNYGLSVVWMLLRFTTGILKDGIMRSKGEVVIPLRVETNGMREFSSSTFVHRCQSFIALVNQKYKKKLTQLEALKNNLRKEAEEIMLETKYAHDEVTNIETFIDSHNNKNGNFEEFVDSYRQLRLNVNQKNCKAIQRSSAISKMLGILANISSKKYDQNTFQILVDSLEHTLSVVKSIEDNDYEILSKENIARLDNLESRLQDAKIKFLEIANQDNHNDDDDDDDDDEFEIVTSNLKMHEGGGEGDEVIYEQENSDY